MPAVLGIDAAWTPTGHSGVALVVKEQGSWRLLAVESTFDRFVALKNRSSPNETACPPRSKALHVLTTAQTFCDCKIDLIAVDMPMARSPILGRRCSDNAVSQAYGARKCGTHSPTALRPGRVSDEMTEMLMRAGYPLQTLAIAGGGLIEVYPHPALVELACAAQRLPYKAAKARAYWPELDREERRARLFQTWLKIVDLLEAEIAGVRQALRPPAPSATLAELKAYEDALDAVVCAWAGTCALEGLASPYGNEDSAIWIPNSREPARTSKFSLAQL